MKDKKNSHNFYTVLLIILLVALLSVVILVIKYYGNNEYPAIRPHFVQLRIAWRAPALPAHGPGSHESSDLGHQLIRQRSRRLAVDRDGQCDPVGPRQDHVWWGGCGVRRLSWRHDTIILA